MTNCYDRNGTCEPDERCDCDKPMTWQERFISVLRKIGVDDNLPAIIKAVSYELETARQEERARLETNLQIALGYNCEPDEALKILDMFRKLIQKLKE